MIIKYSLRLITVQDIIKATKSLFEKRHFSSEYYGFDKKAVPNMILRNIAGMI